MGKRLIEFKDLLHEEFPLIVFSAHLWNPISYLIRWKTKAAHNHVMWMTDKTTFYSQNFGGYRKVGYLAYIKPGSRLKFVRVKNLTTIQKKMIVLSIYEKYSKPWYRKTYDILGIVGQALGLKWLQNPNKDFCVEDVILHLKKITKYCALDFKEFIDAIPTHISPGELNTLVNKNPQYFEVVGYWQYD